MDSSWQKVNGKWVVAEPPEPTWESSKVKKLEDITKRYNEARVQEEMKSRAPVQEWVDTSFIKTYTDHEEMMEILDNIQTDYPDIAKRYFGNK